MDSESIRERSKRASERLQAPACVHAYLWIFMVVFSVGPALCLVLARQGTYPVDTLETSLTIIWCIQSALWVTQRCCSTPDLSYWDGLLVAANSVTTGRNLASVLRSLFLLFAVAVVSLVFAADHDESRGDRHAGLRFANLVICLHKLRLRRPTAPSG